MPSVAPLWKYRDGARGRLTERQAEQAEEHARAVLEIRTRIYGPDHPDTLACGANLAVSLHQAGRNKDAERLKAQILDRFSQLLGSQHPNVLLIRDWLRIDLDLEALPI